MSFTENEFAVLSAEELLTLDEEQLVEFMKGCATPEGGFDISRAAGLPLLPRDQKDQLFKKLRAAARDVEIARESASVDIGALMERLAEVAADSSSFSESTHASRHRARSLTSAHTSPFERENIELICYQELFQNGGRPVISCEILSQALTEFDRCGEKALPWLDEPGSRDQDGRISVVFSRQADRWWEFRKWQIDNRGLAVSDDGFSAYLAAQKSRHSLSGSQDMISNSTFEETVRRMWMMKPRFLETFSNVRFSAYEEAVKKRLAFHNFTRVFQLQDDPSRQGVWETWVEYLNFEFWEADRLAASIKVSDSSYRNAWKDLLNISHSSSLRGMTGFTSKVSPAQTLTFEQRLATTLAELEGLRQKIYDFIRDTKPHRDKEEALHRQKIRTQWVREQLHAIETETAQVSKAGKNHQAQAIFNKKRKGAEGDEVKFISIGHKVKRSRRDAAVVESTVQHSPREKSENFNKVRMTRQFRRFRQGTIRQTNVNNPVSSRDRRSGQRSRATAEQPSSFVPRRSLRLQSQSSTAIERMI